ncbi:MAG: cupin domain-containing protein [Candidatus Woesearchaeota archaeon]|jgi:mannose-6-phosphate isomerase-like protein (cupin superfamily)
MKTYKFDLKKEWETLCGLKDGSPLKIYHFNLTKAIGDPFPHFHPRGNEYYLVLKGRIALNFNGKDIWVKAGEMVQFNPKEIHHALPKIDGPAQVVVFRQEFEKDDKVEVKS